MARSANPIRSDHRAQDSSLGQTPPGPTLNCKDQQVGPGRVEALSPRKPIELKRYEYVDHTGSTLDADFRNH
jgi:hypothetical protein